MFSKKKFLKALLLYLIRYVFLISYKDINLEYRKFIGWKCILLPKNAFTLVKIKTNLSNEHWGVRYIWRKMKIVKGLNRWTDQYPYWANWVLTALIYFWFNAFLTVLACWTLSLCHFSALTLLLFSNCSIRFCFPHPTWLDKSPNLQNFLKLLNLTALKASGTTCLFLVS